MPKLESQGIQHSGNCGLIKTEGATNDNRFWEKRSQSDGRERFITRDKDAAITTFMMMLLACLLALRPIPTSAAQFRYSDLSAPGAAPIPYGEPINIIGNLTDLKADGVVLSNWISLNKLIVKYSVSGIAEKTVEGRIDTATGNWDVVLEPLPVSTSLALTIEVQGKLTEKAATRLVDDFLSDSAYAKAVNDFFATTVGKPQDQVQEGLTKFSLRIVDIVYMRIPNFLKKIEGDSADQHVAPLATGELFKMQAALVNSKGDIEKLIENKVIPTTKQPWTPSEISTYLTTQDFSSNQKKKILSDDFQRNYVTARSAVLEYVKRDITARITLRSEVKTSAMVEDLQRYAGIDMGALYAPKPGELRQVLLVNIYFGPVDDQPPSIEWKPSHVLKRLSLTVGYDLGDISNNTGSNIDGNNAYVLGLGFRLNKYFRFSVGKFLYRTKSDGDLASDTFYALSADLTAFKALQGLVTK